ncbi:MAG: DNA-directed RNA polymerase subunit beta' [Clostridium sp.]|nr:DNA-directed RNA polymerase subunit beta' [Clostridium sp.]
MDNYENEFSSIKIGLASPEQIREWSYGEVTKPETINYRTLKPERDGLFCERIFGPMKDWECHCGKYKRVRYKGKVCERCGVEITRAKVRRERMGHIELAAPVSHIWYFKGIPSRLGLVLDISPRYLEKVLYFALYIVTDPGDTPLEKMQILNEKEYAEMRERYEDDFKAGMGAEAIKELLQGIDVAQLRDELTSELETATGQKRVRLLKRLDVVDAFYHSGNKLEWMILDAIPVIPPDIRPMVQLDGGRFATSDLNDLYRRVINRNNRLRRLLELGAPEIIVRNEKRMLQESVDALIDNGRRGRPVTGPNNRPLKSLSDMLKGKQGRFRQNLLGKRVDYSGRSVIVVGPELKMHQCGLPKEMAIELFKPFVMKRLVETGVASNIKSARKMVERAANPAVWDCLEVVIKDHPVMLNRAPTLHRLGIQAFEPVLVEGRAIKLHPLACTAFNADFDGDQMAVHVPLSAEAQAEARMLMLAANNLLKPSDGKPVAVPTQDMVIGSYYLTMIKEGEPGQPKFFEDEARTKEISFADVKAMINKDIEDSRNFVSNSAILCEIPDDEFTKQYNLYRSYNVYRDKDEAMMAYQEGSLGMHSPAKIRVTKEVDGVTKSAIIITTIGRIIFNNPVPQDLGFVDRNNPETEFDLEVSFVVKKKQLGQIAERCINVHGVSIASGVLDAIKNQGYKYSTISGTTVAVIDALIPEKKKDYLAEAEKRVDEITYNYNYGLITNEERSSAVIKAWEDCTNKVSNELTSNFDGAHNPIHMMVDSGARGSTSQLRQLAGMRGLIANTAGKTIEVPIRANYREGLNILEYFISSRGARKGLADTALRTADSGYLTRRLVDVSQDVIIRDDDCGCHDGIVVSRIMDGNRVLEPLEERLTGRFVVDPVVDPNTGEVLMETDRMMTAEDAQRIVDAGVESVKIRSLITCKSRHGVCRKCYGANLAFNEPVQVGEAVGIIAAQSIGEPGTQLTMRTFHTGGVAGGADITQGLPRVEELFEARKPKQLAILSEIEGDVRFEEIKKSRHVVVFNSETAEEKKYLIPYGARLCENIVEGAHIAKGTELTLGAVNPHDVLAILGEEAVYNYLIKEVQFAYRTQGVDINDKHIEVIVRQMLKKCTVDEAGDTELVSGTMVDVALVDEENAKIDKRIAAGETELKKATYIPILMGITKASLATDSFLSAASFQETTRVLTDAAIKGKSDPLIGLKENVIIGKLVPAGTGMDVFRDVDIVPSYFSSEGSDEILNLEQLQELLTNTMQ